MYGRSEVSRHDIIDKIIEVGSIDEPFSLVAWVHGSPAELIISNLSLHEAPHWPSHHRYWLLVGHDENFSCLINIHSFAEELTCEVKRLRIRAMVSLVYFKTIVLH